jgi:integrase
MPDTQYPILYWSFHGGPNETMGFQGHCGVPPLCRSHLPADESQSDYVFANPDTGRPYTNVGKVFAAACREAGIEDLTFHDLRHTFASRLREVGVDAITRRNLLGHSTVEMSDDYTHSSAESRLRAVQSIADYRKQDYSNFTTNQDSATSVRIAS